MRLTGIPVMFAINYLDHLDSGSDEYKKLVRTLRIGDEVSVWAIPVGPGLFDVIAFKEHNRKPLHELDSSITKIVNSSLGTFRESRPATNGSEQILKYEVVQMERNGQLLVNYDTIAKAIEMNDKMFYWLWIVLIIVTSITGLKLVVILLSIPVGVIRERNRNDDQ